MFSLDAEKSDRREYLLDMIEQLAEFAKEIGEIEVALLLEATAAARRHTIEKREAPDR
jgi:hypothetical protein